MATPAAADVDRLRRRVEKGWAAMDGTASSSAPATIEQENYDFVEDEGSELEKLSRQLNMQTDMNNDLLQQVITLETTTQTLEREAQEKQVALRKALSVCETVRADMADLKRKHALALEQAKMSSSDSTQAKVELGLKQREIDELQQALLQAKRDLAEVQKQSEDLRRDAERAKREQEQWRQELVALKDEEAVRDAERRADVDMFAREASNIKTKLGPLEAELKAEKQRNEELAQQLASRSEEWKQSQASLAELKAQFQHYKQQCERALANEEDLAEQLAAKTKQCLHLEQQVNGAGDLVSASEAELRDTAKQLQDALAMKRELEQEVKDTCKQLDTLAIDLQTQSQGRRADREAFESRIAHLQQDLDEAKNEARQIGKSLSDDAARREQEHTEQRRTLEEAKTRLQNEVARLNDSLLGVQRELSNVREEFQQERMGYEDRIAESTRKQRQMEQQLARSDLAVSEEANRWREKLLEATAQLNARTRLHVETLGALENAMHSIAQECARLEANEDALVDEVVALRAALKDYQDRGNEPLQEWSQDSKRSMLQLADLCEGAEQEARDAREHQIEAEAQLDEEKNHTMMLEEERTRLEDEIKALEERMRNFDTSNSDKIRQTRAEMENALQARADLEQSAKRTQDQLDRANAQTRAIQEDLERARLQAVEQQQKLRDKVSMLEERLAGNEALVNQALAERDQSVAELSISKKKIDAQVQEIAALQRDMQALDEATRGAGKKESKEVADLQKQLQLLKENMRKQSVQFTQTSKLLQLLQEQKKSWLEEKQRLKLELEEERDRHPQMLEDGE